MNIHQDVKKTFISVLQKIPFCISTNGNNDGDVKIYLMILSFFIQGKDCIESCLLGIPVLNGASSGANIGNLFLNYINKHKIPTKNCIGFVADNAAVMMGYNNDCVAVLQSHIDNLIVIGCSCHLFFMC